MNLIKIFPLVFCLVVLFDCDDNILLPLNWSILCGNYLSLVTSLIMQFWELSLLLSSYKYRIWSMNSITNKMSLHFSILFHCYTWLAISFSSKKFYSVFDSGYWNPIGIGLNFVSWFSPTNGGLQNSNIKHLQGHWIILALGNSGSGQVGFIITRSPTQKNPPAYLIDPPKMLMKLTGRFSGFQVGLAWLFFGPLGIFLFLGLLLFLCYFL